MNITPETSLKDLDLARGKILAHLQMAWRTDYGPHWDNWPKYNELAELKEARRWLDKEIKRIETTQADTRGVHTGFASELIHEAASWLISRYKEPEDFIGTRRLIEQCVDKHAQLLDSQPTN